MLWLDAHGDFNTPDTTPSGYLGGMALAGATGRWDAGLAEGAMPPDRVVLAGVRDLDEPEREALEGGPVTVIGASPMETLVAVKNALDGAPVYVHLDLDVIDPEEFPAQFPAPGGLAAEKLYDLLEAVAGDCEIVGMEITAFEAPEDDLERQAAASTAIARPRTPARRDPGGGECQRLKSPSRPTRWSRARRCASWSTTCTSAASTRGWAAARRRSSASTPQDKLTARERLALLIDEGTFTELGIHGRPHFSQKSMAGQGGARRRRDHRLRQGRGPAGGACAPTTSR